MSEKKILTVKGETKTEKIIERSRFLTYSFHAESEEEAREGIARIRAEHSLATHVCFAFVADKIGNLCRFSDDGEPQGTAGMPILEVLKNKGLYETVVAVVRYFGGIKLGAGGLVRAYSSAASENLANADIASVERCVKLVATVDYPTSSAAQKYLSEHPCNVLSSEYGEKVTFVVAVKQTDVRAFIDGFVDYTLGKGEITEGETFFDLFAV